MADGVDREPTETDQIVGELAHEIRNPLNAIGIHLKLLSEDALRLPAEQAKPILERIEIIQRQALQLKELLDDFLRYIARPVPRLEPADAQTVVREIVDFIRPAAADKGVNVEVRWSMTEGPVVLMDKGLFKQAVLNIIMNALRAMPNGGRLTLAGIVQNGVFSLSISDTGTGMTPERVARLFQPRQGGGECSGSGLGLAITNRIVREHSGKLEVASQVGRGTCFTISLPVG